MKFFCEYCGCRIDSEKDTKCPNCGASYKKNATFLKHEEERKEQQKKAVEQVTRTFEDTRKAGKIVFIIAASIIGITIITMIVSMIGFGRLGRKVASGISDTNIFENDQEQETIKGDEKVTVGINEYGKTSKYQVKVTGYDKEEAHWYDDLKDGYEYVTFHLIVENLSSSEITHEDVNCIVNGIAQTNYRSSGYSTLPFFIKAELAVTGDATFEVPIDATSYDIRYGDYVTIHIEK